MREQVGERVDRADASRSEVVCFCYGVTRSHIVDHFRDKNATYDTLVSTTRVGTKCTSCLLDLDLIVDEASGERALQKITMDARPQASGVGPLKIAVDQCNSGFFFNRDGIETIIRFANHGPMFDPLPFPTAYNYSLTIITDDGRRVAKHNGRLEIDDDVTLELKMIPGLPPQGWFLLSFYPDKEALMGSIRPQIGLVGPHWTTCYHPQYQTYACLGRAVPIEKVNGRFASGIHMINASKATSNVVFELDGADSGFRAVYRTQLGGYHAALQSMDEAFPDAPENEVFSVLVKSDQPLRKHVIGFLADGTMSVDHFPNHK